MASGYVNDFRPEIRVRMTLTATERGGRSTLIRGGEYRGVLGVGDEHWSFRIVVPPEGLAPGQGAELDVQFLFTEALRHFSVGADFTVWEGRDIGRGVVLAIL